MYVQEVCDENLNFDIQLIIAMAALNDYNLLKLSVYCKQSSVSFIHRGIKIDGTT